METLVDEIGKSRFKDVAVKLAKRRFNLAKWVIKRAESVRTMEGGFIDEGDGTGTHEFANHQGLCTYLLLTCFDILGSKEDWVDFRSWLSSESKKSSRDSAIKNLPISSNPTEITKLLHSAYLSEYGVKTAFYRFIDDGLSNADRTALLDSVRITRTRPGSQEKLGDEHKKKFLYAIRNTFTHSGLPTAELHSVMGGQIARICKGKLSWLGSRINAEKKSDGEIEYALAKWPIVLFEILANTMGLDCSDVPYQFQVWFDNYPDPSVWVEGLQYGDLQYGDLTDLDELANDVRMGTHRAEKAITNACTEVVVGAFLQ